MIFTKTSIVNFSRLLCVVINRDLHTRAHSEADCRLIFDTGKEVAVTVDLAENLISALRLESESPFTKPVESEQNRKTEALAVSSAS